jgi:hypothetical protein
LILSGKSEKHINAYGGEDRFWLGPEGGQFSLYFKPGVPFNFDNWFVPPAIDTEAFELKEYNDTLAVFSREINLVNYSGNPVQVQIDREVRLLDETEISRLFNVPVQGLSWVGFQSSNKITNTGQTKWTESSGMISVWILGMLVPTDHTIVVIPFKPGPEKDLGIPVNDSYFGKIPGDRMRVLDNLVFFRADGKQRGKLGISPERALPFMGAYDSRNNVLTIVNYNLPDKPQKYVNSSWEIQKDPFSGDVVNSYNDGPLEDGSQMGPFFELESSSPAAGLSPGESLLHIHRTVHLTGNRESLDRISKSVLHAGLDEIENAFR